MQHDHIVIDLSIFGREVIIFTIELKSTTFSKSMEKQNSLKIPSQNLFKPIPKIS